MGEPVPFEERLARLESIAARVKDPSTPLAEAAELYEESMGLLESLEKELSSIEQRISILSPESDEPRFEPFDQG